MQDHTATNHKNVPIPIHMIQVEAILAVQLLSAKHVYTGLFCCFVVVFICNF